MNSEKPEAQSDLENEMMERGRCGGRKRLWWIPLIALAIAAKGALFMLIWNALIPELFHGPQLKFLQAIGLLFLGKMLVGFKHGHGGPGGKFGGWGRHRAMKRKFWARMSEEERCELRDHLRKRWKE